MILPDSWRTEHQAGSPIHSRCKVSSTYRNDCRKGTETASAGWLERSAEYWTLLCPQLLVHALIIAKINRCSQILEGCWMRAGVGGSVSMDLGTRASGGPLTATLCGQAAA